MTNPFAFTHAICRTPAPSAVDGLRDLGLAVDVLPPLAAFPDALFVEDVALTFPYGAILYQRRAGCDIGNRSAAVAPLMREKA